MVHLTTSQRTRADQMIQAALGQQITIKKGNARYTGLVETAEPSGWRGRSLQFKVTLRSGAYHHGPFFVTKLPR